MHQQGEEKQKAEEENEVIDPEKVQEIDSTKDTIHVAENSASTQTVEVKSTAQINETEPSAQGPPTPRSSPTRRKLYSPTHEHDTETPSTENHSIANQPTKKPKSSPSPPSLLLPQTSPQTSSTSPPRAFTPSKRTKRKSPFSDNSSDEEDASLRTVKKVKKVTFETEVISPLEQKRKMSIPYIVDEEGDEKLVSAVAGGCAEGEDSLFVREDEDGSDGESDDLFVR